MKLIVGLGNPGLQYEKTRHNIGFMVIDKLIQKFNLRNVKLNFNALCWETTNNGEKIFFIKPQTYMNLSGSAVLQIKQFYKINLENIIVIYDDKDIPFGKIKLKSSGSSVGHNGVKDIINKLGTENFKRIKLGIGQCDFISIKDWVLGNFNQEELKIINDQIIEVIYKIIYQYLITNDSFDKLMSLYNNK